MKDEKSDNLKLMIYTVILAVFIGIGGMFLSFPLTPAIPFSMQIFFVFLVCFILPEFYAFICVLLYLFLGGIGLPMFAGGLGGVSVFFSPTAGFLTGFVIFPLSLYIPGEMRFLKMVVAFPVFYLTGITVLSYIAGLSLIKSFSIVSVFIPLDIVKLIGAYYAGKHIRKKIFKVEYNV